MQNKIQYRFDSYKTSAYLVTFKLELYPNQLNGEYPFTVTVSGVDAQGNSHTQPYGLEANVTGRTEDTDLPQAEISTIHTSADSLNAGRTATSIFRCEIQALITP